MERAPDYVERDLFARVLVVFIEGARAFKHKKCSLERKVFTVITANVGLKDSGSVLQSLIGVEVCGGRVRCVGVEKICGTVLEMRQ